MFGSDACDDLDPVWKALASPVRRALLDRMRDGRQTTGELAACLPELSRFAIMQHLRVLEKADLVVRRRDGRRVNNYLNPVPIQQIYDRWVCRYRRPWAETLVDLRYQLEEETHGAGESTLDPVDPAEDGS